MDRLTKWNDKTEGAELISWDEEEWKDFMGSLDVPICTELSLAVDKLAEYEYLEEQEKLIRLPCKPNEMVWCADEFDTRKVMYGSASSILSDIEHGKGIGHTKEEAEQALAKMKEV